jgi:exodeoxyribonuclease VII small subunit
MSVRKKKSVNFETNLLRLEEIVENLESGEKDLEESITLYEEGMKLYKECSLKLDNARQRVEVLLSSEDGNLEIIPFDDQEEEPF